MALPGAQCPRLGKQSSAGHWHWRRAWLVHAPERVGDRLAHAEKNHSLDRGERSQRYSNAAGSSKACSAGTTSRRHKFYSVFSHAIDDGGGQPLSSIQVVGNSGWRIRTTAGRRGKIGSFALSIL